MSDSVTITYKHLQHAVAHRKDCNCDKSDYRDPRCAKDWPDICPWWGFQLHRHISGDFSSPEWWAYQLRLREDYSDQPPDPKEFDPTTVHTIQHSLGRDN